MTHINDLSSLQVVNGHIRHFPTPIYLYEYCMEANAEACAVSCALTVHYNTLQCRHHYVRYAAFLTVRWP